MRQRWEWGDTGDKIYEIKRDRDLLIKEIVCMVEQSVKYDGIWPYPHKEDLERIDELDRELVRLKGGGF